MGTYTEGPTREPASREHKFIRPHPRCYNVPILYHDPMFLSDPRPPPCYKSLWFQVFRDFLETAIACLLSERWGTARRSYRVRRILEGIVRLKPT